MIATLDRYIFKECLPTFVLALGISAFVLMSRQLFILSDMVISRGVGLGEVLKLLALAIPPMLPMLLPSSLLLAVLMAMGRLCADSEVVAMRSCGVGLASNLRPVMALSFLVFSLAFVSSVWLQPGAEELFKKSLIETVKKRLTLSTRAGTFTSLNEGFTFYAGKIDDESGRIEEVFLQSKAEPINGAWVTAEAGSMSSTEKGILLELGLGEIHHLDDATGGYRRMRFDKFRVILPTGQALGEAGDKVADAAKKAAATGYGDSSVKERLERGQRYALPFSCIVFGLLGATLGLHHSRAGKSRGGVYCIFIIFLYYAIYTVAATSAKKGAVPPELAAWLPNIILGAFGVLAFVRKNREQPTRLELLFSFLFSKLPKPRRR